MTETTGPGYIYVKGWKKFQHPDVVRGGGRLPWIRDYTDQLNNDAYLSLSLNARGALQDIRRLAGECGNGRVSASPAYLERRLNMPRGYGRRVIDRLSQAGFIEVRASKAQAPRKQRAGRDREGSKEPKKEIENAHANGGRSRAAIAGAETKEPDPVQARRNALQAAIAQATSWQLDDGEPRHLVEQTTREAWPDLADEIIAHLPKPAPEGSG